MSTGLGEIVLYRTADGGPALDVRLERETVWLSQAQLVDLFQRDQSVISRHLRNVFKEGELPPLSLSRVVPAQIHRLFEHYRHPDWPADFD